MSDKVCQGMALVQKLLNTTRGSEWIIQVLSMNLCEFIPNAPRTNSVSTIQLHSRRAGFLLLTWSRKDIKYPPTAVGGIPSIR